MLEKLLHLFTPRTSNNHRARILHPAGLSVIIAIYLFTNASVRLFASVGNDMLTGAVLGYASNISASDVIDQTNAERAKVGQPPLSYNALLSLAAQSKAGDIFTFNYWAHNNPTNGKTPWDFIREAGYTYRYAGENLARDFGDTPSMIAAWMASPTHRDNIVSDRYTEIGVAVVNGTLQGVETTLVVQMFGNPAGQRAVSSTSTLGETQASSTPTPQPTQAPSVSESQEKTNSPVTVGVARAQEVSSDKTLMPPIYISKAISMSILLLLSLTLIIDYLVVKRRKTVRVSGKNLAHLSFLGILIIIVLLSAPGGIL